MSPATNHTLPHTLPLTLIVATTPIRIASTLTPQDRNEPTRLGIGLKGNLPWPRIKADMNFFARVTSRPPVPGTTNAIIMGRKTYDSVPSHLRPLGKRISVVVTRDQTGSVKKSVMKELEARKEKLAAAAKAKAEKEAETQTDVAKGVVPEPITDVIVTPSLDAAISELDSEYGAKGQLGKIWIIGGAEIYGAALRMKLEGKRPVRIVVTNVVRKGAGNESSFECDTFFPLDGMTEKDGWRRASSEEVSEWVGEEVEEEWKEEGDVEIQMVGYERLH
ncbi:Dihydrofolate reductase [Penicillium maclennaniae]|uniref:Dihydrofolate reductase n=1 Tax=Penicillium maclennaniae TaxID=1343394 RepID=UPI00253FD1C8|nr:Dihydrofolate reductase [Penicillium maclennaniae]KAJ5684567.1 Dihydrofolate reductase [Penicillium maclennaniae]